MDMRCDAWEVPSPGTIGTVGQIVMPLDLLDNINTTIRKYSEILTKKKAGKFLVALHRGLHPR